MATSSRLAPPVTGIQCTVKGERVGVMMNEAEVVGGVPVILCTVRMTSKGIRGFVRCCLQKDVHVRECRPDAVAYLPSVEQLKADVGTNASATFECLGTLESLEYLVGHPSVAAWGYCERTVGRVGRETAAGAGPEKVKGGPGKPKNEPGHVPTDAELNAVKLPVPGDTGKPADAMGERKASRASGHCPAAEHDIDRDVWRHLCEQFDVYNGE